MQNNSSKRVLLIENHSQDFYKARIPLAKYLKQQGLDVFALVPNDEYVPLIKSQEIHTLTYSLSRNNKGILQIIKLALTYRSIIKKNKIDVIHSFRFQPNLINILASLFLRKKTILHVTGLGIAFANNGIKYQLYRFISQLLFQLKLLLATKVIFQNHDDTNDIWLVKSIWKNKVEVVKGSGVDTKLFNPKMVTNSKEKLRLNWKINEKEIVFICVTRLLWEKGIKELCEAFRERSKTIPNISLFIVGSADLENPRHINSNFIHSFDKENKIKFLGNRNDVKELLAMSDVFIYPSYYREGIPRGILEALSMAKPIITTNTAGCNLTVVENSNGLLISPRSKESIQVAISEIIKKDLSELGKASRFLAEQSFSEEVIFKQIRNIYNQI